MMGDRSHMTERILNLTLEIIYLLTGEKYTAVKMASIEGLLRGMYPSLSEGRSRSQDPPLVPSLHPLTPEKNEQKIIEVTNKMIELLTGEVSGAGNSLAISLSMEERQYQKGHKELYKVAMMEEQTTDGVQKRHASERSPHPPYSRDFAQEVLHGDQREELKIIAIKTVVTDDELERAVTVKEEERAVTVKEEERAVTVKEEEVPPIIHCDGKLIPSLEGHPLFFTDCGVKGEDLIQGSLGESTSIMDICPELSITYNTLDSAASAECSPYRPDPSRNSKPQNDKPFSCSECGKCFIRKASLAVHQRLHTGEHLFPCQECGKKFVQKSLLITHQRTHTGEKPFSCSQCRQSFAHKSNLVQHEQVHRGNKPFKCSECGKRFTLKWNLIVHGRTHTGERPFQCFECGRSFTQKSRLADHQRLHRGDKPFTCSKCKKCFTVKADLILHARTHTGEKP